MTRTVLFVKTLANYIREFYEPPKSSSTWQQNWDNWMYEHFYGPNAEKHRQEFLKKMNLRYSDKNPINAKLKTYSKKEWNEKWDKWMREQGYK